MIVIGESHTNAENFYIFEEPNMCICVYVYLDIYIGMYIYYEPRWFLYPIHLLLCYSLIETT